MANVRELDRSQSRERELGKEVERLATLVSELQEENAKLRQALAKAEAERQLYLKAVYENARATLHFEDVDISDVERMSAGPLEIIE